MKKKNGLSLAQILQADIFGLLWRFVKGMWSSFNRLMRRSLNPSTGQRPTIDQQTSTAKQEVVNQNKRANPLHISPLIGVADSHNLQSLTVRDLLATVQWQGSTQAVSSATVASVKDKISWD